MKGRNLLLLDHWWNVTPEECEFHMLLIRRLEGGSGGKDAKSMLARGVPKPTDGKQPYSENNILYGYCCPLDQENVTTGILDQKNGISDQP